MTELNRQQFLPGMEHMTPSREASVSPGGPRTSGQWSGPIPGQTVMGVHSAEHGVPTSHGDWTPHRPFEADGHGFIYEGSGRLDGRNLTPSPDKHTGNDSARDLYGKWGGGFASVHGVKKHWDNMPLVQVNSDTPVHTSQAFNTTEYKAVPGKLPGRERINEIRESLRSGEPIREPAWLVRQSGRLYSMDGHHRIVAAREEGLASYPARLWDRDKEGG